LKLNPLEIESVFYDKELRLNEACRVRIKNQSHDRQARDLKVELVKIFPAPAIPGSPDETLPILLPLRLFSKQPAGNIINPNGTASFELFGVTNGLFRVEIDFLTDAHQKTFVFESMLQSLKHAGEDEKPFAEYQLTIAAEADKL
jgi:hypothetical protein